MHSQDTIGQLSIRIEQAYRRKSPGGVSPGLSPVVWSLAASRLLEAPDEFPGLPVDPELFVAVQPLCRHSPDPWSELTQKRSLRRYLNASRRIIRQLRQELKSEVRRAEERLNQGLALEFVMATEGGRLSPLGRYILAYRSGRFDLSIRSRSLAQSQHRSCPLYRFATISLIPSHIYPLNESESPDSAKSHEIAAFSMN